MATNHTTNYQLCQWEATDKVLRTDFNEDNQKIDAALAGIPKITFGVYTGNGAASRTIALPFTPKVVFLCDRAGHTGEDITYLRNKYWYGGLAFTDQPVVVGSSFTLLAITEGGFTVGQLTDSDNYQFYNGNASGVVYHYLAIG